jgi:hypothetical protein
MATVVIRVLGFDHQAGLEQARDDPVEASGTGLESSAGLALDGVPDRVAVHRSLGDREQSVVLELARRAVG